MYLSDLLSDLSKNESIKLSKPEIAIIFKNQKHITLNQRIALFHKLDLRNSGETQLQVAARAGVSRELVAQYDAVMSKLSPLNDSLQSSILDALCAGELWEEKRRLEITGLNKKLTNGYQPQCIEHKGDRWYIQWKSLHTGPNQQK